MRPAEILPGQLDLDWTAARLVVTDSLASAERSRPTVTAIKPKKTAKQVKEDKIGKAAYYHELKDLMGSAPSLKNA
jgi:hypothetical protein